MQFVHVDLHGYTLSQREEKHQQSVVKQVRTLFALKSQTCPSHAHLFPADMEAFLLKTPTSMLSYYHRVYENTILVSVFQATSALVSNTRPITQYFTSLQHSKQPPESVTQALLVFDAYSKKKRHKQPVVPDTSLAPPVNSSSLLQTKLQQFF